MLLYRLEYTYWKEFFEPEPLFPDEKWLEQAKGDILCPQCLGINRKRYPQPLEITINHHPNQDPEAEPIAKIKIVGVTIWHSEVLDKIRDKMPDFVFGKCYLPDGSTLPDYFTCYTSQLITVRGGCNSRYQICPLCGLVTSHVKPGPQYVLSRDLSTAQVYQDSAGCLYLTEDAAFGSGLSAWEGIGQEAVSVRDVPADGQILPGDIPPGK